jgi:hypothetical protein
MRTLARRAGAPSAPGRAREGVRDGVAAAATHVEGRHLALMGRQPGAAAARSPSPPRPLGAALLVLTLGTLALAAVAATALSALAVPGAPGL